MKDKYYRVYSTEKNAPRLVRYTRPSYLYIGKKVENPDSVLLGYKFKRPIPRNPVLSNFLSTPRTIFSKIIVDVLKPLEINTIQLLPAEITDPKNEIHKGFFGLNICKRIKCIDKEKSNLEDDGYGIYNVKKIVLDQSVFDEIPLEDRLIFMLGEHIYDLFHESIVEAIMEIKPSGIGFVNFEDFNDSIYYKC